MDQEPRSVTLNDDVLKQLPEPKRAVYVFEWLRYLESTLPTAHKNNIKECQKKLVEQLTEQMQCAPGPPTRKLIANCLATLYSVGDTFMLFDTVNACNDILKNKDDSPSYLPKKLAAICVLGCMYEKLGRMMGRSYEDTVQLLLRTLRNAESQARIEIMTTFEKVCAGMGTAITNVHKDIYKAAKHCLLDRVMAVRVAAAKCILEMLNNAPFLYQTELENLATLCFRAFDGSNYEVRSAVASLLGTLLAFTQKSNESGGKKTSTQPYVQHNSKNAARILSLDEALGILMSGFLRGGVSFLKGTGEMIKGSSSVNREVRVGVTHAYVVFVQYMGSVWLERNLSTFIAHTLDLVANPKAASSHVDAVYSRKCINFILRSVIGKILGEKAQMSACKELIHMVAKQMNSIDFHPENAKDSNQETLFSQHLLVCAMQELGSLIIGLGTTAQNILNDQSLNAIDATCAVLVHPCAAARLAAAWCLRCYCVAVPSQITPLIDRFVDGIEQVRSSPEATAGYSSALAAILGSVRYSPLGIPHTKGKVVFNCAEELLRSASQNSRMSLQRTQAGWLLIGSIMTLGSSVVKGLLPRMLLLWRNSFPRSNKELDSEKARGDAFTWQVTLEGRAGALSVMHSFLLNCPELVTDDIMKRLYTPIESALAMLVNLAPVLKSYGTQLKAPAAMVRFRLFETLTLLPPTVMESSYTFLLRMLVAEFTLADNPANTTNSILRNLCHGNESIILGTWLQESDHCTIEDQMEPNRRSDGEHLQPNSAAGSGALEHDQCYLYRATYTGIYQLTSQCFSSTVSVNFKTSKAQQCPGPLPLGVAVIDMSVILFGLIFPKIANKHRVQVLEHFGECIKQSKSIRQEAVQMNIFTALLSGLKGLTDSKASIGQDDVKKSATNLILGAVISTNATLRCAAGEALGRMAQVVGESHYTAELAQNSFDKLKSARDVVTRTGHSHALGCLHRYVGGMSSSQHLGTSVSILLALAQDTSSPVVQVWSLYALALIADSGGPMFRSYVEATLTLCLKLLLNVPHANVDVHQCSGRVLNALITTVGPELQAQTGVMCDMRSSFLCAAALMQAHSDPLVQAESIGCVQQLHLFAPKYVNLSSLVPNLVQTLASNYFILRKAAVSCLRQLAHREAKEACELALSTQEQSPDLLNNDFGLPGLLFGMLDSETDAEMLRNIHDTLTSMLQALAADNLTLWLSLCKNVLTVAIDNASMQQDDLATKIDAGNKQSSLTDNSNKRDLEEDLDDDDDDDDVTEYHAEENNSTHPAVQPRWPTRVFAAQCVRKIMKTCELVSSVHFDLIQAKALLLIKPRADFLVLHLSELIRMSFMAATSDSDQLRLEGLRTLQEIIDKFANIPEPEFPGHLLLEQFQAQVGAAVRPAFSPDTPSHVTAAACEVCSAWIGSGVARDLNDLRRVHQLLVSSLNKLQSKTNSTQLYNESMATLEKLSILKAWAEVYIVAMIGNNSAPAAGIQNQLKATNAISPLTYQNDEKVVNDDFGDLESRGETLLSLVEPELENLSTHWLAAMKDHALLLLPSEFQSQLPHDGGAFYTTDTINLAKPHYLSSWPPILYAAALWLRKEGFAKHISTSTLDHTTDRTEEANNNITHGSLSADRFHMIFGICMEALCNTRSTEKPKNVLSCLKSLYTIFDSQWACEQLVKDKTLAIELCNVLHRQILTQDDLLIQLLCMEILKQSIGANKEDLHTKRERYCQRNNDNTVEELTQNVLDLIGEGGETGELVPEESHVYAVLEVCLCLFVRHIPSMNPSHMANSNKMSGIFFKTDFPNISTTTSQSFFSALGEDNGLLVACGLKCIEELPDMCSPKGALSILPSLLYMTTSIIREVANKSSIDSTILANTPPIEAALCCLKSFCVHKWSKHPEVQADWLALLQSALATILDLTKTADDNDERRMDEVTMLLAIAAFILHTTTAVVSTPSLQYPCINHFRQCTLSDNLFVKLECIQTMRSIFAKADLKICTPYIHALAPRIIEGLYGAVNKPPISDMELRIIIESILTVETLIELAEPSNRIQMLTILVPVLINYLADPTKLRTLPKYQRHLHEQSLQWLMKIGPKYSKEFKALMSQSHELRNKLENAIRHHQQQLNISNRPAGADIGNRDGNTQQQKPTIKLKTDFSNFQ